MTERISTILSKVLLNASAVIGSTAAAAATVDAGIFVLAVFSTVCLLPETVLKASAVAKQETNTLLQNPNWIINCNGHNKNYTYISFASLQLASFSFHVAFQMPCLCSIQYTRQSFFYTLKYKRGKI